jgi:hypothetical protein
MEELMSKFPETVEGAECAGYKFVSCSHCKGCGRTIEWYSTPLGKRIPIDVVPADADQLQPFNPHWTSCPKAAEFRKQMQQAKLPAQPQQMSFEPK